MPARLSPWRAALHRGERSIAEFCAASRPAARGRPARLSQPLAHAARAGQALRHRFFVAAAPSAQTAAHDGTEMVEQLWIAPGRSARAQRALKLLTPTRADAEPIGSSDVAEAMAWAAAPREVALVMPRSGDGREGLRPVMPDEPAWAESAGSIPQGHGHGVVRHPARGARCGCRERVIRVTADNGSVMTGPGTNTYLVGAAPANGWAVIDPGPATTRMSRRSSPPRPGRSTRILVTHTHMRPFAGGCALKARTGATCSAACAPPRPPGHAFAPDHARRRRADRVAPGTTLRVIHTPGHASNHLCYLLEEEKTLFTGDHVMQGSTVVINPPDGDMAAYWRRCARCSTIDLGGSRPATAS